MRCDWVKVEGESMRPVLRSGDWIGVEWCSPEQGLGLGAGDLVVARAPDGVWLVHRMIRAERGAFVLKGDASSMTETLRPEEIWGKVVALRRASREEAVPVRVGALDRLIAALSRRRFRRTVFALGVLRRFGW